jgi:hypothetical protein
MSSIERRDVRERSRSHTPRRSASADRYLSPSESSKDYDTRVRRSFTPLREMVNSASARYIPSYEYSSTYGYSKPVPISKSTSWRNNTNPFVITTHAIEDQPMSTGKYDVFIPGGWSYPIYRYLHKSHRPDLSYQPGGCYYPRKDYGHNIYRPSYMAGEMTYYHADINRALHNYRRWTRPTAASNYYQYEDSSLRHFAGYRPRYVNHFIKAVWI